MVLWQQEAKKQMLASQIPLDMYVAHVMRIRPNLYGAPIRNRFAAAVMELPAASLELCCSDVSYTSGVEISTWLNLLSNS